MRSVFHAVAWALFCMAAIGSAQQPITPEQALARVLQQTPAQEAWFAPVFLSQVPLAKVDEIVKQYGQILGKFQRAEAAGSAYTLVMEKGAAPARIHLDTEGRIDGLWFGPP